MLEFDPAVTFHIHANMFQVYRTGRSLAPSEETDVNPPATLVKTPSEVNSLISTIELQS